ncbi:MAG: Gfo/Idh/MocA family oxidoreductase [Nitrospinae bacterium]|nr:Gfo/Idh/MocA family oxidoreductase [Nitrospinota bacterium]
MAALGGEKNPIGLAIVGCGRVGRIRARCAREYPGTEWLGCCDIDEKKGKAMAEEFGADFFTTDFAELIQRPEVNAVIIATDEEWHAKPLWESIAQGHKILVEKPLATSVVESAKIVEAAEAAGVELQEALAHGARARAVGRFGRGDLRDDARAAEPPGRHHPAVQKRGPLHAHAHGDLRHPCAGCDAVRDGA